MKVSEAIKAMMKSRKMTQTEVAERIGKNQNSVAMYLKNADSMRLDNLMKMAEACGYSVVLMDKGGSGDHYVLGEQTGSDEVTRAHNPHGMNETMREVIRDMVREELAKA